MTIGRLTAKMRKMREDHEDSEMENGELNLVPFLDIVTNVIMFLMMTTTFAAALTKINVNVPTTGGVSGDSAPTQNRDLNLTVSISERGFTIAAAGAVLYENDVPGKVPTIPKTGTGPNDYDYNKLTELLRNIKNVPENAEESKVILNANNDITYEVVVATMDAARGKMVEAPDSENAERKVFSAELFGNVLLSAGVN